MSITRSGCYRCGGALIRDYFEWVCLNCGRSPERPRQPTTNEMRNARRVDPGHRGPLEVEA